ncbi:hypothetical protein [Phenylobacterium sp.]|jgi:hypothetical protein|uniref:hypothetical protein n=1 Tax=Phenylobacterium sp. TaxID=1871053 RepID=UPI002E374558|nr:hypothetical protein [Phenylobacterium sp.]HEX3364089.1 hypothetical protein [Phenylobacterium sp.]
MTVVTFHIARPAKLFGFVGPLLALAVLAFLAGFGGYLILGPANVLNPPPASTASQAPGATPADVLVIPDAPNPPKAV